LHGYAEQRADKQFTYADCRHGHDDGGGDRLAPPEDASSGRSAVAMA